MKILLLLPLLFLVGCGSKPIQISTKPVEPIPLVIPSVDQYKHRKIKWIIVTPENAKKVFEDLQKKGQPVVLFALTSKGYENLSLNTSDQIKITSQLRAVIEAYKKYYLLKTKENNNKNLSKK